MKKIIALLLVLSMVLSFAACGKKDEPVVTVPVPTQPAIVETEPAPVETEPVVEETEPVIEEPVIIEPEVPVVEPLAMPTPELPADEAVVADKQAKYEAIFTEGTYTMNTNAVTMNFANLFKMGMFGDDTGKSLITLEGSMEGLELGLELYVVSDTEAYYHRKGVEEGVAMDAWYKLENLVNEDGESAVGGFTQETDSLDEFKNNTQSITYIGQVDGKDAVEIVYLPESEDADFLEPTEPVPATIILLIEADTANVTDMYMEQDGMIVVATMDYIEDLATICNVPADVTETMAADEAAMEIAFGMMGFILAAAGAGLE